MNPIPLRLLTPPGKLGSGVFPVASRFRCGVRLRASLPLASNRAFIRTWAASRARAGAAAAAAKSLAK